FLVEGAELFVVPGFGLEHFGEGMLGGGEGAEDVVLVDLAQFGRQRRWGDAIADLPAGAVVGLAEAGDDEGALAQGRVTQGGFVAGAVEDDVFVHLVGEQPDAGAFQQFLQLADVVRGEHGAGGVVGGVDDQHPGPGSNGGADAVPVRGEGARVQRDVDGAGAGQGDGRLVTVIGGVEDDRFLACLHHGVYGVEDGFGGPAGDGDFGVRVHLYAVDALHLARDRLAQGRDASHGRVLVVSLAHGAV